MINEILLLSLVAVLLIVVLSLGSIFEECKKKGYLALIPIGAYSPYWFEGYSHVTPDEAIQIAIVLESTKSIGMHWGTFILSDEPILEPKEWLKKSSKEKKLDFITVKPGELIDFSIEF